MTAPDAITGKELALLGCAWPMLVGLVGGVIGIFTPTFALWLAVGFLWLVASLPCFVFLFRGLYRVLSPDKPSELLGVLAAVIGIPIAGLSLYLGGIVFASISQPTRFA